MSRVFPGLAIALAAALTMPNPGGSCAAPDKAPGGSTRLAAVAQSGPQRAEIERTLAHIVLPPGFAIALYALVPEARAMAVAADGLTVFVGTNGEAVYAIRVGAPGGPVPGLGGPRRPARTLAILGSAAAVAALAVGLTWVNASGPSTPAGPAKVAVGQLSSRVLAFSIPASSGMHVAVATTLGSREQSVDLLNANRSTHLQLDVFARGAGADDDPVIRDLAQGDHVDGLRPVRVGGVHGFGGSLPGGTSTVVAWPYAADAWAMVVSQGRPPGVAYAARVGGAVSFAGHTVIRIPIRINAAPAGMHLVYVNSAYAALSDNRPREDDRQWHTEVEYSPSGKGNGIEFSTTTLRKGTPTSSPGTVAVTIDGREGTWDPAQHAVCFTDPTNAAGICAQEEQIPTTAPLTMSRQRLLRVAATITLAPRLDNKSRWFAASTALPQRAR